MLDHDLLTRPNLPQPQMTMSISISILDFFLPQGSADFLFFITSHQTSSNPKFIPISISISNSIFKLFPHRCGRSMIYWQSKTFPHPQIHADNHFKLQFSMFLLHNLIGIFYLLTRPNLTPTQNSYYRGQLQVCSANKKCRSKLFNFPQLVAFCKKLSPLDWSANRLSW